MTSNFQFTKLFRTTCTIIFALGLLCELLLASPVLAKGVVHNVQDFNSFVTSVQNGEKAALRGVYVPNVMAFPVVQQPAGFPGFVAEDENVVTQFGMAAEMGNAGLLAHNYLAGYFFPELKQGDAVYLVYGDGHTESFLVTQVLQYQALDPYSPYSEFKDINSQTTLTAEGLFNHVYRGEKHVVFQTCIEANGNSSWGRLFVIAEPVTVNANLGAQIFRDGSRISFWHGE